jgi:hypothetical protein
VVSFAFFVFVLFVPLVAKKELRGGGELYGGQAVQIGGRDGDLSAEARMLADIFQFGGVLRVGVQQGLDALPIGERPIVVFFRPNRSSLDDERFTVRIKFVGHGEEDWGLGVGKNKRFRRGTCAARSRSSNDKPSYRFVTSTVYWRVRRVEVGSREAAFPAQLRIYGPNSRAADFRLAAYNPTSSRPERIPPRGRFVPL